MKVLCSHKARFAVGASAKSFGSVLKEANDLVLRKSYNTQKSSAQIRIKNNG